MKKKVTIKQVYELLQLSNKINLNVLTPYGFKKILACDITAKNSHVIKTVLQDGRMILTSPEHLLKVSHNKFKKVVELNPGEAVLTIDGKSNISIQELLRDKKDLYDIQVEEVEQYYSNGIISHNSSIIDSLLYTVYNTTSKNNRKNLNVINQNRANAIGKVEVEINGDTYTINRTSEKYTKKLKGVVTTEAKTDVEFTASGDSLNGLARNDTDKNIRKFFGTVDDFFLTSMASQFGYLSFIGEGSTNRKSILAKFLDLEPFEKKYKKAKEESAQLKALLKKLEGNDYDRDIANAELQEIGIKNNIADIKNTIELTKQQIEQKKNNLEILINELKSVPVEIIDYDNCKKELETIQKQIEDSKNSNISLREETERLKTLTEKVDKFLALIDREQLIKNDERTEELTQEMIKLEKDMAKLESSVKNHSMKLKLLEDIPCGNQFTSCKFIKDAFLSKEALKVDNEKLLGVKQKHSILDEEHTKLDEETSDKYKKMNQASQKKEEAIKRLLSIQIEVEKNNVSIEKNGKKVDELKQKIETYDLNREAIENFSKKTNTRKGLEFQIKAECANIENYNRQLVDLYKQEGSVSEKIETLKKQKQDLHNTQIEYAAYDLLQTCMHSNGISYEIIKQKLPVINSEIAKILSNIVEFSIFLVNDDDKLDIMIKHPKYDARPLEMGSGAEKTLASTAIRLALLNVTTLPKGDIFVMDEPGTALDQENLDGFIKILELIKTYFKTVIVISHLDTLKDCVDTEITIERKDGYAFVNM